MKQKQGFNVYAIVGIVIVVAVVIGLGGTITGNAISRTKGSCSETDEEQKIYEFGVLKIQHRSGVDEKPDECLKDEKHLRQFWCSRPNRMASVTVLCPNGCTIGKGVCNQ